MGNDLVPSVEWDFSQYRPGDVLCIPKHKIAHHGQAVTFMALAGLSKAAGKAGLLIETSWDDMRGELRVVFK